MFANFEPGDLVSVRSLSVVVDKYKNNYDYDPKKRYGIVLKQLDEYSDLLSVYIFSTHSTITVYPAYCELVLKNEKSPTKTK